MLTKCITEDFVESVGMQMFLPLQPEILCNTRMRYRIEIEIETCGIQYSLYEFTEGSCSELKTSNQLRIYIPQLY